MPIPNADIRRAMNKIVYNTPAYQTADSYYEGNIGEVFTSPALRQVFRKVHAREYLMNFCGTIVDAVLDRTEVKGIAATTQKAQDAVDSVWKNNEMDLEATEIHKRALIYGDCYAMVWPDENGDIQISYTSPQNAVIVYDPDNPRKKLFGAKFWEIPNEMPGNTPTSMRLNMYYPDRIVKYTSQWSTSPNMADWRVIETIDNPFGEVPMFHFRTGRPYGRPEHFDAYKPQNIINKLVATHMYTIDYQGAPQRYALANAASSATEVDDYEDKAVDRENITGLKNGPGELWYLKGVQSVGQFSPADPQSFLDPLKTTIQMLASITSTPIHYFDPTQRLTSSDTIRAAEAPLIKKIKDRQLAFGVAWHDLFVFALKVMEITADVQIDWADAQSNDLATTWDIALKKLATGMPFRQVMREAGYDEEVIDQMIDEKNESAQQEQEEIQSGTDDDPTNMDNTPDGPMSVPTRADTKLNNDPTSRITNHKNNVLRSATTTN